jgi:hypothetical protein
MSKNLKPSLKSIVAASAPAAPRNGPAVVRLDQAQAVLKERGGGTLKERARQLSVYLEPPIYDQLRAIAFAERTKMHALMLEAVDLLFRKRGARSIEELVSSEGEKQES